MRQRPGTVGATLVVLVAAVAALSATNLARYTLDVGTSLLILVAVAQAWNLLAGFSRQFSLGVSVFVGAGAYGATLTVIHLGVGAVTAVGLGAVVAAVLAAALSPALLRLRGDYLTIGTLAAALAVQAWAVNSRSVGGSSGLNVPLDSVPDNVLLFRLALLVVALASLATVWFMHSPVGLRVSAVGQDQEAATILGVNVWLLRLLALVLNSALTGAAGAVVALQQVHVEPIGAMSLTWTIDAIVMTVIGGPGTFVGPFLGAALIYLGLTKQLAGNPVLGLVLEGVLLIAVIRFAPQGIWPLVRSLVLRRRSADGAGRAGAARPGMPDTPDNPAPEKELV